MTSYILHRKLLSALGLFILLILMSGTLYKEREIEINLITSERHSQSLEISLFNKNKELINYIVLNDKNSESFVENNKTNTKFWIDPTYTNSFYIKNISPANNIHSITLKNALGITKLNYRQNKGSNRLIVKLPRFKKDPLLHIDLLFSSLVIIFLLVAYLYSDNKINSTLIKFFLCNKKKLRLILVLDTIIVICFIVLGNKTYSPFKIQIKGKDLPSTQFSLQLDTGVGFNDIEKFYFRSSNKSNNTNVNSNSLQITNSTTDNSDKNEVFIYSLTYNNNAISLSDLENPPNIRTVFNNLFISQGHSLNFKEPFQSAALGFIKHPKSGTVNISVGGNTLIEENLWSPKQEAGNIVHLTNSNLLTVRNGTSITELIVNHPYWNTHVNDLLLSSPNLDLQNNIDSIQLTSEFGSTDTKLQKQSNELKVTPINDNFNSTISKFQITCLVILLSWISYITFLLQKLLQSEWFKNNFTVKPFAITLTAYSLIMGTLLTTLWPGVITADSFLFVGLERGNISNYKPLFYTLYLGIFTLFSSNPCYPIIFQILILGIILSFLVSISIKNNVSYFYIILSIITLVFSPTVPLYMLTLWKDIPYSEGILILGIMLYLLNKLQFDQSVNEKFIFGIILPFTILISGFRHTGFLLPLTISILLFIFKYTDFKKVILFLSSTILLSHFSVSTFSIILNTKAKTDFKRLELFPYLIYGSYIPWNEYLKNLPKDNSVQIINNTNSVASVYDLNGITVMYGNNKANLKASYPHIKAFKKEVLNAAIDRPFTFLGNLFRANISLLSGEGYVWDEGFLPIKFSTRSDSDNYYINNLRQNKNLLNSNLGLETLNYLKSNIEKDSDSRLTFLFSAWSPIIIIFLPIIFFSRLKASIIFSVFILINYAGVFLLPASLEFRYAFHLILAAFAIPMLIGLDQEAKKS